MMRTKVKPKRPLRFIPWLLLVAVFVGELFFYTWCRVQYLRIGYEVVEAADKYKRLTVMHKNLTIELARLKSPMRIEGIATRDLGLMRPTSKQIIYMP